MLTDRTAEVLAAKPRTPPGPADRREATLTRNRGLHRLMGRLPELTDLVVTSLRASEPSYRSDVLPAHEPPLWISKSISHGLKAIRSGDAAGTCDWPRQVGPRRAQQGVPLSALMRAYHIGGQVLCSAFMEWANEEKLPQAHSIALADEVWNVADTHCAAAAKAYRTTEAEMPGSQAAGGLLDALLNGETDADFAAAVAHAWELPERGRYAVVVQRLADGGAPLGQADLPTRVSGMRVVWRMHGECAIGVVALRKAAAATIADALPAVPGRRTGVSLVVDGLTELGRARRHAELATRTLAAGHGVACLEERLPTALLTVRPDLANELKMRVLAPVLSLDQVNRDLLLDTLAAWMAADGSALRAATALFCHRNTVLNRLRRLERLTGRSLSVPKNLVEFSLALEAFRLRADRA